MVDNVDQNLGRLLDTVEALGELDNTIVVFTSDNGGTAEGGAVGTRSYFSQFQGLVTRLGLAARRAARPRADRRAAHGRFIIRVAGAWPRTRRSGCTSRTRSRAACGCRSCCPGRPGCMRGACGPVPVRDRPARHTARPGGRRAACAAQRAPVKTIDGVSFRACCRTQRRRDSLRAVRGVGRQSRLLSRRLEAGHAARRRARRTTTRNGSCSTCDAIRPRCTTLPLSFPTRCASWPTAWEAAAAGKSVFPLPDAHMLRAGGGPRKRCWKSRVRMLPGTPTLERYRAARLIALRSFAVAGRLEHDR